MTRSHAATSRALLFVLVFALVAVVLARLLTLGMYPLMDTTEARYAEIARKMSELGDWVTPWFDYGVPFWGKPPLAFWLTAASFKVLGINEFAARLPHWLSGLLIAWLVWDLSARRSRREAAYTLALLAGSALFFVAAGAVMTDMALAVGTTLAMRGFWLGLYGTGEVRLRERWLLFVGLGVGLLAKGPVALVLALLPIAAWTAATRNVAAVWRGLPWLRGGLLVLTLVLPWYALAESHTPGFLNYFLVGEHWQRFVTPGWKGDLYGNAHDFPRGTIWVFLLGALLPWTVLLPFALFHRHNFSLPPAVDRAERQWRLYLLFWGLTPCVFFTAAGNILWTYVLPGLPALALWTAARLTRHPSQARVERLLASGLIITVLGMTGFLVNLEITGRVELKSAKTLIASYLSLRTGNEALIFLHERPYSAGFYSQGKAEVMSDAAKLIGRLGHGRAFVAIKTDEVHGVPAELRRVLQPMGRHGRYTLFVAER